MSPFKLLPGSDCEDNLFEMTDSNSDEIICDILNDLYRNHIGTYLMGVGYSELILGPFEIMTFFPPDPLKQLNPYGPTHRPNFF